VALIKAHPESRQQTQRAAGLTAESNAEQNSVGLDRLSDANTRPSSASTMPTALNSAFPYIVCVRRHTKDSILRDFEAAPAERRDDGSCGIDRRNLPDRGVAAGSTGQPAMIAYRCMGGYRPMCWIPTAASRRRGFPRTWSNWSVLGENRIVTRTLTNHDGRTDQPLIGGRPVPNRQLRTALQCCGLLRFAKRSPLSDPAVSRFRSRYVFSVPNRKAISTCRYWSRRGAMRRIEARRMG